MCMLATMLSHRMQLCCTNACQRDQHSVAVIA
jgi:hypothetical protein